MHLIHLTMFHCSCKLQDKWEISIIQCKILYLTKSHFIFIDKKIIRTYKFALLIYRQRTILSNLNSLNILTHSSLYVSNNSFPCFLLHLRLYLNFATLFYRTSYRTYYITWLVYINFYIYFTPLPFHSYIFFCIFHSRNSLNNSLSSLSVSFPGVRGTLCGPLWSPWRPPICWGPWEEGWLYDVNWFSPPE